MTARPLPKFEIQRIVKYIQDGHRDTASSFVFSLDHKIAELSIGTARQLGEPITDATRPLIWLRGLHAWCHEHFEHTQNPSRMEVIKTPARMMKELEIPDALSRALWEPIRKAFAKAAAKDFRILTLPVPKITGSSAVSTCLILSLAAALGFQVKIRMGGIPGCLHYMWGSVFQDEWHDVDILLSEFGKHPPFEETSEIEVPI